MFRFFRWIRTNVLYGAAALIPVAALLLVGYYLYTLWRDVITPIAERFGFLGLDSQLSAIAFAVVGLLVTSFIIGTIVRTRFGSWTYEKLEQRILVHLPGYGMLSTLLRGFADDEHAYPAALASLQPGAASVLCFVMEDYGHAQVTVFVPTAPMMTVGQIYSVARENIEILPDSGVEATGAISQWGVGLQASIAKGREAAARLGAQGITS